MLHGPRSAHTHSKHATSTHLPARPLPLIAPSCLLLLNLSQPSAASSANSDSREESHVQELPMRQLMIESSRGHMMVAGRHADLQKADLPAGAMHRSCFTRGIPQVSRRTSQCGRRMTYPYERRTSRSRMTETLGSYRTTVPGRSSHRSPSTSCASTAAKCTPSSKGPPSSSSSSPFLPPAAAVMICHQTGYRMVW